MKFFDKQLLREIRPFEQIQKNLFQIFALLSFSGLAIGAVFVVHYWRDVPFGNLTRDAVSVLEAPIYTGFLSQMGILFWSAAATICFFVFLSQCKDTSNPEPRNFFFLSGLLTTLLGLDDGFLFHEVVFPRFGIPEKVAYLSYMIFMLYVLIRFLPFIVRTNYILLMFALSFFAVSVALDVFDGMGFDKYLMEDGSKFFGIVSWFGYFLKTALDVVKNKPTNSAVS